MLTLAGSAAAETCFEAENLFETVRQQQIEYASRHHEPGYQFSIGETRWQLRPIVVIGGAPEREFEVLVPTLLRSDTPAEMDDFFFNVHAIESTGESCSDVAIDDQLLRHPLPVRDASSTEVLMSSFGVEKRLIEATRFFGTELHVRIDTTELLISAGFATQEQLDVAGCVKRPEDNFGFTEPEPGQIYVTCFSTDNSDGYIGHIDWQVGFGWPEDRAQLIDELIDYVSVRPLALQTSSL